MNVLLGKTRDTEPVVGKRQERQNQRVSEASSEADPGRRCKAMIWLRVQMQQTPAGSFQANTEGGGQCSQDEESRDGSRRGEPAGPGAGGGGRSTEGCWTRQESFASFS